ncbi:MAG TPA: glycosyltransferase family 4 protein [Aliarcobacter sp.]|nr:glycosyltransferase family 4 protein [Aliarcobacter sp.]
MKILIVNTSDIDGGAARAAYRLHKALLSSGVDSQMLVQNKTSDDYTVLNENKKVNKYLNKLRPILDSLSVRFYKNRTKTLFSPSFLPFSNIVDRINEINPDIVHLHWICGGMMRIEDIARIKAPIVWSLHDMWAFTGGCHYDEECKAYEKECGNCKVLGSQKENDLSRKVFKRKQKVFNNKKDITIVGLSNWLNECSKSSTLLKNKNHINLPNPIDTDIFKPFDKNLSRELWNLPKDKKLILFGAMGATSDLRKGFKQLSIAIQNLDKNLNIEFVVFGSSKPQNAPDLGFKTHYLGSLHDDVSLVTLYSAVDVMIVPSLQENLSNAIMESLSCGTPVVAFDIGGNSDMIEHQNTGYLAKPFDATDLKDGIEWVLNSSNYDELCVNTRKKVLKEFDSVVVAGKYVELYKEVLDA